MQYAIICYNTLNRLDSISLYGRTSQQQKTKRRQQDNQINYNKLITKEVKNG